MNYRRLVPCFFQCFIVVVCVCGATGLENPDVPEGIRYVRASEVNNKWVHGLLKKVLQAQNVTLGRLRVEKGNEPQPVVLGPLISERIMGDQHFDKRLFGKVKYKVDLGSLSATMDGILLRTGDEVARFDTLFSSYLKISPQAVIRKPSAEELAIIWYWVSWDIDEPIYVVEDKTHRYVVDFDLHSREIQWVEDLSHLCFRPYFEGSKLLPCFCMSVLNQGKNKSVQFHSGNHCSFVGALN